MLINAGVNMPAPLGAPGVLAGNQRAWCRLPAGNVGAALAAALVLQPVSCMCKAQPKGEE